MSDNQFKNPNILTAVLFGLAGFVYVVSAIYQNYFTTNSDSSQISMDIALAVMFMCIGLCSFQIPNKSK